MSVNFISLVTSCVGLQKEEPQTAHPFDFNNCLMHTHLKVDSEPFMERPDELIDEWFNRLKPVVVDAIDLGSKLLPGVSLYHWPILARSWWHPKSREFAKLLDHNMKNDNGVRVKLLNNRTFFSNSNSNILANIYQNPNRAFLECDCVHLNYWGTKLWFVTLSVQSWTIIVPSTPLYRFKRILLVSNYPR